MLTYFISEYFFYEINLAQSTGARGYTECVPSVRATPSSKECSS